MIPSLSADVFRYWITDYRKGTIRILLQDGRDVTEELPTNSYPEDSAIALSVFDWENWWMANYTDRGELIISGVYSPLHESIKGRPVVYLDQNHWSRLRLAITDPKDNDETRAARRLIELAQDAGVILPLSSGHLGETTALFGEERYALGILMASLTGGWQLRHPIRVWRQEMAQMIGRRTSHPLSHYSQAPVVTLEPGAWMNINDIAFDRDPQDPELFQLALTAPSVTVSILLHPEKIEGDPLARARWAETHQRLTDQLNRDGLTGDARRKAAEAAVWDLEIARAKDLLAILGIKDGDVRPFSNLREVRKELRRLPMLSRLFSLMVQRHSITNTVWKPNDLIDLLFLCCASAYADYVVAENHTGTQLQQLRGKFGTEGAKVTTTIVDLVAQLTADGVQTAAERAALTSDETSPTGDGVV